jgi:hypothetical protein
MIEQPLADKLEDCLAWMQASGGTPEQAAGRYPEQAEALLPLLRAARQTAEEAQAAPSAEFRAAARARMMNLIAASEKAAQPRPVTKSRTPRPVKQTQPCTRSNSMTWIVILGILAAALAGGGGAAYASADALPGDALYPVKTGLQDLELAFSGDETDIELLLGNMDGNLSELAQLAGMGRYEDMEAGLEEYQTNLMRLEQTRTRINYEDAGAEDALQTRIQSQLMTHAALLEQLKLQTKDQIKLQEKLQQAIQLTETGKTYGPNEGGQPEEPGQPNGAGPGEPQGTQTGTGKPEDAGPGDAGGSGNVNGPGGNPDAGSGSGAGGQGEPTCTCMEPDLFCVESEVQDAEGKALPEAVCTCQETGELCTIEQGQQNDGSGGNGPGGNP